MCSAQALDRVRTVTIRFNKKLIACVVNDAGSRTSDPTLNGVLASAEQYFVQARTTNPSAAPGTLSVYIEPSNDDVKWGAPAIPIFLATVSASGPTNFFGYVTGLTPGRFVRLRAAGSGGGFYLEVWLCGRSAH